MGNRRTRGEEVNAKMKVRTRRNKGASSHHLTIPASIGRELPPAAEWEMEVTDKGFLLVFLGAAPIETTQDTVDLPFVQN